MDDQFGAEIERLSREALARPCRLSGLTDEWVTRTVVRQYFQTLIPQAPRRHLVDVGAAAGGIAEGFLRDGWSADLFEPDPVWEPAMRRLRVEHGARCRVHQAAACGRDVPQISFSQNRTPGLSGLSTSPFGSPAGTLLVRGVRLDTFLAGLNLERVDFLKIDTEGSDFEVLETHDFVRLRPSLIFVEYSYYLPSQTPAVVHAGLERMRDRGYRSLIFDYEDDGNFKRGNWQHRLVSIHADPKVVPDRRNSFGNILYFRDDDEHLPKVMLATIQTLS